MNATAHFAAAVQELAAALLAVCRDPADAVRTMRQLAELDSDETHASSPVDDLFRRMAVIALARAAAAYTPSSYDEAQRIQAQVNRLIEAEIMRAADQGEDAAYQALRALQAAVKRDLTARGANLARIKAVVTNEPLPALTLAQRLYREAGRADELVRRAHPVHPAFMPLQFQALAP
jgi:prophage DNA circulation protein